MNWFTPLTDRQNEQYDKACTAIYNKYGSFNKVATAITAHTDQYLTGQTVREWMRDRKIPTNHAITMADLVPEEVSVFSLLPWMKSYTTNWYVEVDDIDL